MSDVRSINHTTSTGPDEYIEQLRQQIGTDFSDRKQTGKKRNEMGKDDFIKLMTAQLKHQDPINPMKNEQMAAQLAQFSALEQMVNMNQNLEKMTAAQKPQDNMMAASLIGKKISTDSSKFILQKGSQPDLKFDLPADADKMSVSVVDNKGEIVREYEMAGLKKGKQSIKWDGKNAKAQELSAGEYSFRVNALDANGTPISVGLSSSGLVSGVVFESGKAMLLVDGKKIPFDVIDRIESDSSANSLSGQALKKEDNTANAVNALTDNKQKKYIENEGTAGEKNINDNHFSLRGSNGDGKINKIASLSSMEGGEDSQGSEAMESNSPYPLWNPSNN